MLNVKVILIVLLLSNFSAFAQKTNIWIIRDAESNAAVLATNTEQAYCPKGSKALKLQATYIPDGKVAE